MELKEPARCQVSWYWHIQTNFQLLTLVRFIQLNHFSLGIAGSSTKLSIRSLCVKAWYLTRRLLAQYLKSLPSIGYLLILWNLRYHITTVLMLGLGTCGVSSENLPGVTLQVYKTSISIWQISVRLPKSETRRTFCQAANKVTFLPAQAAVRDLFGGEELLFFDP